MRILQLSTHATLVPTHGGQLRSHHIGRVLEQHGFDLRRLAFVPRGPDDLDDPREPIIDIGVGRMPFWNSDTYISFGPWRVWLGDYLATGAALRTPEVLAEFDARVRAAAPDVILLEHPWTWPLLARLDEIRSGAVRLVYSSQNVEMLHKRRMSEAEGVMPPDDVLKGVEALEKELVAHAVGVSACTRADADAFRAWGASRVVVAPNGGVRRVRDHLLDVLPWPLEARDAFAFVVGGAYPPNVSGFVDLVAPALAMLRPNQKVAVAGKMAQPVAQALAGLGQASLMDERLVLLGPVDEFCLDCLIANAHVIVLPIRYGGGSNLKTAEALLAGRPIVAAEAAMRGFEDFCDSLRVALADDAKTFGRAMMAALDQPFAASRHDEPALGRLLWESTIAPLVGLLREVEREIAAERSPRALAVHAADRAAPMAQPDP